MPQCKHRTSPKKSFRGFTDGRFDPAYAQARPLAMEVLRTAAAEWRETTARHAAALERYEAREPAHADDQADESQEWTQWIGALAVFAADAERRLIGCLLMLGQRIDRPDDLDEQIPGWSPVGFQLDSEHYFVASCVPTSQPRLFVIPNEDFQGCEDGSPTW